MKFTYLAVVKGTAPYRSALKWVVLIPFFYILYPIWQFIVWIGLWLDELLFPDYAITEVREPIFIIGNPRSGTTFLHRLMAKDHHNFTTIKTWEIFASPSIVGRHIYNILARIDRKIGSPIIHLIERFDKYLQTRKYSRLHKSPIWEPEEDDNLLLHIWSSIKVWIAAGLLRNAFQYVYFDQKMPLKDRDRIFKFYKGCLKRHIYYHKAQKKRFLSKSPYFSSKLETILRYFPDAKIIYLVRNPMHMVPSYMNMLHTAWTSLGDEEDYQKRSKHIMKMAEHWYDYPLKTLAKVPPEQYIIVKLEYLANNTPAALKQIYTGLGLRMTRGFSKTVAELVKDSKETTKVQKYKLRKYKLTKKMFYPKFRKVFSRFKFKW